MRSGIHDAKTFSSIRIKRRHVRTDIRPLCAGWVTTYHVWKLGSDAPAAAITLPLEPEAVYYPLRKFLDQPISNGIYFPLEIGADAMSFCVLRTVYFIKPDSVSSKILSHSLNAASPHGPDFMWAPPDGMAISTPYFYNLQLSPSAQFLALHESMEDGNTHISVFECLQDDEIGLSVESVNRITLTKQVDQVEHLTFHQGRPLLAFCGTLVRGGNERDKSVFIWDFSNGEPAYPFAIP